jgi:hypothetical protein
MPASPPRCVAAPARAALTTAPDLNKLPIRVNLNAHKAAPTGAPKCLRNAAAFLLFRSISYSAPPTPNRTVSFAGPPSRSSSRATVIFVAIPTSMTAMGYLHRTDQLPCPDNRNVARRQPPPWMHPSGAWKRAAPAVMPRRRGPVVCADPRTALLCAGLGAGDCGGEACFPGKRRSRVLGGSGWSRAHR